MIKNSVGENSQTQLVKTPMGRKTPQKISAASKYKFIKIYNKKK